MTETEILEAAEAMIRDFKGVALHEAFCAAETYELDGNEAVSDDWYRIAEVIKAAIAAGSVLI